MSKWETFKLSELRLDQENYRTGPVSTQRAALSAIIDDQKGKLANLAEDILAMGGVSPGEPIWVTRDPDAKGMYVVLEGNRRVAALKLMETPALADGTVVEDDFRTLAKQYEPPRDCRRLQLVRSRSHDEQDDEQVFPRVARARDSDGCRACL